MEKMLLDVYWYTLLALLAAVCLVIGHEVLSRNNIDIVARWRRARDQSRICLNSNPESSLLSSSESIALAAGTSTVYVPTPTKTMARPTNLPSKQDEVVSFCRTFLPIYLLVMSSEWLSGPYLYTLLRDDRDLPEAMVCALYATAYTSAAASAPIVGFLADRFGRRAACLVQCVVHVAACLTVVLGGTSLPVLFIGRVLAGVGLTLLWTVFESWMVTEWNARGFSDKDENAAEGATTTSGLSTMFGIMTIANCMTAIVGGMLGHCMVSVMGSKVWPFWTGIVSFSRLMFSGIHCTVLTALPRCLRESRRF